MPCPLNILALNRIMLCPGCHFFLSLCSSLKHFKDLPRKCQDLVFLSVLTTTLWLSRNRILYPNQDMYSIDWSRKKYYLLYWSLKQCIKCTLIMCGSCCERSWCLLALLGAKSILLFRNGIALGKKYVSFLFVRAGFDL